MVGYSGMVVVEWNKWSRVRRLDTTITIVTAINLFVDDDSMSLMMVVLFCSRVCNFVRVFYWTAYSGKDGVECGGQSETGRIELGD